MKKILIALDYYPSALKVAEMGYLLGKTMKAEVILFHVISDPVYYASVEYSPIMGFSDFVGYDPYQLDNVIGLKQAAQHFLEKTKRHLKDENIRVIIGEGDIADSVLETAESIDADLVVVGTHSRKWLENIIVGSVAEEVLRKSKIPLFIVPTKK